MSVVKTKSSDIATSAIGPLARAIQREMNTRGWCRGGLARASGLDKSHIARLLRGDVKLSRDNAVKLSRALGQRVEYWLDLEAEFRRGIEAKGGN